MTQLLTIPQVAGLVQLDETTIRRAIRRGDLTASKPCGQLRVHPDDFDAWLADTRVQPTRDIPRAPAPRGPRLVSTSSGPARSSFRDKVRQERGAA